jgi:hypothetical protein
MPTAKTNGARSRLLATAVALAVVLTASLLLPQPALAGNVVTRWVEQALAAVRTQNVGTPNAGRLYAMVTVAMYDAVNGLDRARDRGREHALVPPAGAPKKGHRDVAAAAAAHAVLRALTPGRASVLDAALDAEIAAAGGLSAKGVAAGRDWGASVGGQVVSLRSADGTQSAQTIAACSRFALPTVCEPGEFHESFDARWRNMTPFGIASAAPYLSEAPPALDSPEYAAAFHDVRTCGSNSPALDAECDDPTTPAERNEISTFWLAEGGTVRETGTWLQATLVIVEQEGTVHSVADTARLFALVGMAVADAVKLSWETKTTYFSWRPRFAIQQAHTDGNPDTDADPSWFNRIASPGGSPEYNSGTSAFAGAASAVLEGFYRKKDDDDDGDDDEGHGRDKKAIGFCFQTDLAATPRCYASPLQGAEEAGRSRIFQGIHFQFSNEDGRRAGRGIGTEIVTTRLRRIHSDD